MMLGLQWILYVYKTYIGLLPIINIAYSFILVKNAVLRSIFANDEPLF